jgi:hypothetical protein
MSTHTHSRINGRMNSRTRSGNRLRGCLLVAWLGLLAGCARSTGSNNQPAAGTQGSAGASGTGSSGTGVSGAGASGTGASGGACIVDGTSYPDGTRAIPAPDGCNTCACDNGVLACTLLGCPAGDECLVARKLDSCCAVYEPHTRAEIAQDECLVPYMGDDVDPVLEQKCMSRSELDCALVDCAPQVAPSRLAARNTEGECAFADECSSDDDCVLASDPSACCSCPEAMPRSLVESDECLLVSGEDRVLPDRCLCKLPVICAECPEPAPNGPTCVAFQLYSRCMEFAIAN